MDLVIYNYIIVSVSRGKLPATCSSQFSHQGGIIVMKSVYWLGKVSSPNEYLQTTPRTTDLGPGILVTRFNYEHRQL